MNWYGPPLWTHVLCAGWGELDAIRYVEAFDMRPGRFHAVDIAWIYDDFEAARPGGDAIIVGHNVAKHDLPRLSGMGIAAGLGPLPELQYRDTMNNLKTGLVYRNTLRAQCERYGIRLKTGSPDWDRILQGFRDEWAKMREYNVNDVVCTLELEVALDEAGLTVPTRVWNPKKGVAR